MNKFVADSMTSDCKANRLFRHQPFLANLLMLILSDCNSGLRKKLVENEFPGGKKCQLCTE